MKTKARVLLAAVAVTVTVAAGGWSLMGSI